MKKNDIFILGLTGSIGMGKSTAARVFKDAGVPVWDADEAVHRLYTEDKDTIEKIGLMVPQAISDGIVVRGFLRRAIEKNKDLLVHIEAAVHPQVSRDRNAFILSKRHQGEKLIVCDIPLLFETGAEKELDAVLVVSVGRDEQKRRVMQRSGMTESLFEKILKKQMPDAEKRARADYVIETRDYETTRQKILSLIDQLTQGG